MSVKRHEPYCLDFISRQVDGFDAFWGDSIDARWTAAGLAGGSAVVVDAEDGGVVRITCDGDTNDNYRLDWGDIRSLHVNKKVTVEIRVKLTQTTNMLSQLAIRFDADNRICFYYAASVGSNWVIRSVDGGVTTSSDSGIAVDTDWHIFRIACFPAGEVHFYIDNVETSNSPITSNIPSDAADYLQPYLRIDTEENAEKSMDINYVWWRQDR